MNAKVHRFARLDSTNLRAKELAAAGATEGTVVVAETQTAGRGSGKRLWHSPSGGLYASYLLFPRDPKHVTDLSLLAGAAVAQAVAELLPKSSEVTVKWPNDCLVGWKKVAGVLCESLGEDLFHLCVVGIGINVNTSPAELVPFTSNPFSATSFNVASGGGTFDIEKVLSTLSAKVFNLYDLYKNEGFGEILKVWERNCRFIGKKVELRESGWREDEVALAKGRGMTQGTMLGIDDSGALVLSNAKGERHSYYTGEITCYWSQT